ncbi:MAG: acetyltransferase [Candidatus Eremiobacteraeota bacterium]|nr:acetyltransferase [Candidatus Eremiobacteraeota bacterium]
MNGTEARPYPRTVTVGGADVELRSMRAGDEAAVLAFARELPTHDLLFLPRDITHPKVLDAWVGEIERGAMISLLAVRRNDVVGNATIVRDPLSWSPHVGELRVVVARSVRGNGLGRILTEDASSIAIGLGIEKLVAHMTVDQLGAISVFEGMGYRAEALLRDHVKDRDGRKHDLVILSHDVETVRTRMAAYGLDNTAE